MTKRAEPKSYELVRWQVAGLLSRFHVRHPGDLAALCGDPIITTGEEFMSRPPYGRPSDGLALIDELFGTKARCHGCTEAVSRGD